MYTIFIWKCEMGIFNFPQRNRVENTPLDRKLYSQVSFMCTPWENFGACITAMNLGSEPPWKSACIKLRRPPSGCRMKLLLSLTMALYFVGGRWGKD